MFRFSVMSLFLIVSVSFVFAGTPPVYELKLLSNQNVKISANNAVPHIEICAYGDNYQEVIPSEWYCEPLLPEGLKIVRGEGSNNCKLYIKGIAKNITPYKRYRIFALNNGNKVKKIDSAFVDIDIVVQKGLGLYLCKKYNVQKINLETQSVLDINLGNSNLSVDDVLKVQDQKIYCVMKNPVNKQFFVAKDILKNTEKIIPIEYITGFFNGKNFVVSNETNVFEMGVDGNIVKIFPQKVYGFHCKDYVNAHYICTSEHEVFIYTENGQLIHKQEEVKHLVSTPNGFIYVSKNNLIYSVSIPSFQKEIIEIENFDIDSLFAPIIYRNQTLFIVGKDLIYKNYCVLKKDKEDLLPMIFGKSSPRYIEYCNGYIAAVSEKTFKVFDSVTGEEVYEYKAFSAVDSLLAHENSFVISTDNNHIFFDSAHLTKENYEPFKLPREDFSWYITSEKPNNIVAVSGDNITALMETTNASIYGKTLQGMCVAIADSFVATIYNSELFLYDRENQELIAQKSFPDLLKNVSYHKESSTFWGNYENIVFSAKWENKQFQINEVSIDDKIHDIIIGDENTFVCGEKGIHILSLRNNTKNLHEYPHPFTGLTDEIHITNNDKYIFLHYLQNAKDFDTACIVFDMQKQKIQNSFLVKKDGVQADSTIRYAKFLKENQLAILFTDNLKSQIAVVDLENPDLFTIGNSKWIELSTSFQDLKIIPGNSSFAIPAYTRTFVYDKFDYTIKKTLSYNGFPSDGFFVNNKYFICNDVNTLKVIDSLNNQFLGTVQLPFPLQSYVIEQK